MIKPSIHIAGILLLSACGSAPEFPEDLSPAPVYASKPAVQYFDLVFPDRRQQFLSLQLALVSSKSLAANVERTLLKHHMAYQWLRVATSEGPRWLLVTEPYTNDHRMPLHRAQLRRLLPSIENMPVLAAAVYAPLSQPVVAQQLEEQQEKGANLLPEDNL